MAVRVENLESNLVVLLRSLQAESFEQFCKLAFKVLHPGKTLTIRWYHRAIFFELLETYYGRSKKLAISLPPRMLKSMICSVFFPAWVMGRDPTKSFLCVAYAKELSDKFAHDFMTLVQSPEYKAIFPKMKLRRSKTSDLVTTSNGGRLATSFDGVTTGRGADFIIIDDPMKPMDALSEKIREHIQKTYSTTLISRRNEGGQGVIIMVAQRTHADDLIGRQTQGPGWRRLALPSFCEGDRRIQIGRDAWRLYEDGELLDGERLPSEDLEEFSKELGAAAFAAQYQQEPMPLDGNTFKREWFAVRYGELPPRQPFEQVTISVDAASKTGENNDYSAVIVARKISGQWYVVEATQQKLEFNDLRRWVVQLCDLYRPNRLLIEDSANGTALIQHLQRERPKNVPMIYPVQARLEKAVRIASVTPFAERGDIVLPMSAAWLPEFERDLFGYPNARHDDLPDALAQLLIYEAENAMPNIRPLINTRIPMGQALRAYEHMPLEDQDLSDEFDQGIGWL